MGRIVFRDSINNNVYRSRIGYAVDQHCGAVRDAFSDGAYSSVIMGLITTPIMIAVEYIVSLDKEILEKIEEPTTSSEPTE